MRRDEGFAITDRISVKIQTTEKVHEAFHQHKDYICHEVLATDFSFEPCQGSQWDLNGEMAVIMIRKHLL